MGDTSAKAYQRSLALAPKVMPRTGCKANARSAFPACCRKVEQPVDEHDAAVRSEAAEREQFDQMMGDLSNPRPLTSLGVRLAGGLFNPGNLLIEAFTGLPVAAATSEAVGVLGLDASRVAANATRLAKGPTGPGEPALRARAGADAVPWRRARRRPTISTRDYTPTGRHAGHREGAVFHAGTHALFNAKAAIDAMREPGEAEAGTETPPGGPPCGPGAPPPPAPDIVEPPPAPPLARLPAARRTCRPTRRWMSTASGGR